jgi:hypothetical protein
MLRPHQFVEIRERGKGEREKVGDSADAVTLNLASKKGG